MNEHMQREIWQDGPMDGGRNEWEGGLPGFVDGGVREWKGRSMDSWNLDGYTAGSLHGSSLLPWLLFHIQAPLTFEVYSSIPVEVHVSDNFLYVSVSHLMTQEFPHGLSQLTGAYLPITIGIKLERAERREE